ncbi:enoyl-CoA hydratase-related protein [Actibacterium sp.]|uniref:enoyl-CoA hydratase-related protein n=1 Tax=Actibacterium sp. TaxID=1872125 RepID=UPI00356ACE15
MAESWNEKEWETILVSRDQRVAKISLNRPGALNALNAQVMLDVTDAVSLLDQDDDIGCIVITGSERAFAAGADIREMIGMSRSDMFEADYFGGWEVFSRVQKPIVAAVSGFALGGGFELALMCDFIIAADNAKFGLPEVKIGVMPAMGGTQRVTRILGKCKAMEMCLTGRMIDAAEAKHDGIVARVVPAEDLQREVDLTSKLIASMSLPSLRLIKEAITQSEEMPLSEGVRSERRAFHGLFGSHDQIEGMTAFVEKRAPNFTHK